MPLHWLRVVYRVGLLLRNAPAFPALLDVSPQQASSRQAGVISRCSHCLVTKQLENNIVATILHQLSDSPL